MKNTIQKEKLGGLCCRMERTEDRIGEIQGKTTERKGEKNEQSPRDLWDDCKLLTYLSWKFWKEWRQGRSGKVLKEMMAEHFPNSVK